jgi:hypothetical protein
MRRHRAGRPVCRVLRGALKRCCDHLRDLLIRNRARFTRTRLVKQTIHTINNKPAAPLRDRHTRQSEALRELSVVLTISSAKHYPCANRQTLRRGAPPRPPLQNPALLIREHDLHRPRPTPPNTRRIHPQTLPTTADKLTTQDTSPHSSGVVWVWCCWRAESSAWARRIAVAKPAIHPLGRFTLKVIGSASFGTVDVLADGTGLSSRAGSALLALTAQRLWGCSVISR